jgi:hypothetical protein
MFAALQSAIHLFEAHGADARDVKAPPLFAEADAAHHDIEYYEMAHALAFEAREHVDRHQG